MPTSPQSHINQSCENVKNDLWLAGLIFSTTHLSLSLSTSISPPRIFPAFSICVRQLFGLLPVKLHERTGGCTFQPNIALHSGNSLPCLFPSARSLFLSAPSPSSRFIHPAYAFPSLAHTQAAVCWCSSSVSCCLFCTLWCIFKFSHASSLSICTPTCLMSLLFTEKSCTHKGTQNCFVTTGTLICTNPPQKTGDFIVRWVSLD